MDYALSSGAVGTTALALLCSRYNVLLVPETLGKDMPECMEVCAIQGDPFT
jgi:hypothetical protein